MNREDFENGMNSASPKVDKNYMDKVIRESLTPLPDNSNGTQNLVIIMEEFMEAAHEVSKYLRGKADMVALTEELADAYLSIRYVQQICGISDDTLNKAINVKLERQDKRNFKNVNWRYEISLETPEILGSGSTYSRVATATNENDAFALLADGRNRLERIGKVDGKLVTQIYDSIYKRWE